MACPNLPVQPYISPAQDTTRPSPAPAKTLSPNPPQSRSVRCLPKACTPESELANHGQKRGLHRFPHPLGGIVSDRLKLDHFFRPAPHPNCRFLSSINRKGAAGKLRLKALLCEDVVDQSARQRASKSVGQECPTHTSFAPANTNGADPKAAPLFLLYNTIISCRKG